MTKRLLPYDDPRKAAMRETLRNPYLLAVLTDLWVNELTEAQQLELVATAQAMAEGNAP